MSQLSAAVNNGQVHLVTYQELVAAMQLQKGYNLSATTNVARFQAQVILTLARQAQERDPNGPPLLIGHEEWYQAFLGVTGQTRENIPIFTRLAYEYRQTQLVDYNGEHVIKKIQYSDFPELAVNVKISWPETADLPSRYSFQDTLSTPHLKVTNNRVITFRLLDFGDMIVYDDIQGLTGRPTSGILGLLFRVIGEGQVLQSRMSISKDGLQINRTQVRKGPFHITETVTVEPNGHAEKGLPPRRQDLLAVAQRLKQVIKIRYVPFKFPW
ncbi:MAG: hypothetical protein ACE5HI_12935 [bacterium]